MDGHLTDREQQLLDDIESGLRRDDPALERLLRSNPSLLTRFWHRPRLLAALACALIAVTAAGALYAGAGAAAGSGTPAVPLAGTAAGVSALLLVLVFRRLRALRAA